MARRGSRLKGRDPGPTGPVVLALETGGDHLGVALWRLAEEIDPTGTSWRLLEDVSQHRGHRHADTILSLVDEMLSRHELAPSDIELIAVGRGPGGFTGVRVGMATALGLGQGLEAQVWTVDSLMALAMNAATSPAPVLALIDARKGEVYGGVYGFDSTYSASCLMAPVVAPAQEVVSRARAISDELIIVGSGALVSGTASPVPPSWHVGSAAHLGTLAARSWEGSNRDSGQAPAFDPAYVRASDAEIALEQRLQPDPNLVEPGR